MTQTPLLMQPPSCLPPPGRGTRPAAACRRGLLGGLALVLASLGTVGVCLAALPPSLGQAAWEYRPYRVRVLLAVDRPSPRLAGIAEELAAWLPARSGVVLSAVWQIQVQPAPPAIRDAMWKLESTTLSWQDIFGENFSLKELLEAEEGEEEDKLFLLRLRDRNGATQVLVREADVRTRRLGPSVQGTSPDRVALPRVVWDALTTSFHPLARIERVEGRQVVARLRAGGLWDEPWALHGADEGAFSSQDNTESELRNFWTARMAAWQPVLRRNQRDGQPEPNGIQPVAWTLLHVERREGALLHGRLYTALRSPLPPRGSARLERLALAVPADAAFTTLQLRSREEGKPLVGYEVYRVNPPDEGGSVPEKNEETDEPSAPRLVGVTDAWGAVTIPREAGPFALLVVRHGRQLLARLPLVPGQAGPLVVELPDDDPRLVAEALADTVTTRSLDLVALREVLATRLRGELAAGRVEPARQLLEQFRRLPSRADLMRELQQFQQQVSSPQPLTQARIQQLFAEAQKVLLQRPLSDDLVAELAREVANAGR